MTDREAYLQKHIDFLSERAKSDAEAMRQTMETMRMLVEKADALKQDNEAMRQRFKVKEIKHYASYSTVEVSED